MGMPAAAPLELDVVSTVLRMVELRGSFVGSRTETQEALDVYARHRFEIPLEIWPLRDLPKVYELFDKGEIVYKNQLLG